MTHDGLASSVNQPQLAVDGGPRCSHAVPELSLHNVPVTNCLFAVKFLRPWIPLLSTQYMVLTLYRLKLLVFAGLSSELVEPGQLGVLQVGNFE
jgi:hypothetical protein